MAYGYFPQNFPQIPSPAQQTSGFVSVRSEAEARSYPVAYGNSVTFKDETSPYIYTKTMGFSQLDRPVFDKYKLVKEETAETTQTPMPDFQTEISKIWEAIAELKKERDEGV